MTGTKRYTEESLKKLNEIIDPSEMIKEIGFRADSMFFSGNKLYCFCPLDGAMIQGNMEIDLEKKIFLCATCHRQGDLIDLFAKARKVPYEDAAESLNRKYGNKLLQENEQEDDPAETGCKAGELAIPLNELQRRREGVNRQPLEMFSWKLFKASPRSGFEFAERNDVFTRRGFDSLVSQFSFTAEARDSMMSGDPGKAQPWAVGDFYLFHKQRCAVDFIRDRLFDFVPVMITTESAAYEPQECIEFFEELLGSPEQMKISIDGSQYSPEEVVYDFTRVCREVRREIRVLRDRYDIPEDSLRVLTDGEVLLVVIPFGLFGDVPSRHLPEVFSKMAAEFAEIRLLDGKIAFQESKTAVFDCYHIDSMVPLINRSSPWSGRTFVALSASDFTRMSSEEVRMASRAPRERSQEVEIARVPKLVQYYHDLLTSILTPLPDLPGVAIEAEPSVEAVQVQAETIPRTGEANDFRFWPQTVISMPELTSALKKRQEYLSGLPGSFIPALDSMLKAGPGEVLLVLGENVFETAAFGFHLCFSVCLEAEFPLLLFGSEPGPERLADMVSSQDQNFLDGKMAFINTQIGYIPHLPVGHELDSFFEQLVIEDTETIITGSVSDVRAALRLADKLRKAKLGGVIASSAPSNVETGDFAWEFSLGSGTYSGGPGGVVLLRNCGDHRFEADIIRSNIGSPGLVAVRFVPSTYRFKENGHDGDGRPA